MRKTFQASALFLVLLLLQFSLSPSSQAQRVKRNPDGTVEVYDDEGGAPAPQAPGGSSSSGGSGKKKLRPAAKTGSKSVGSVASSASRAYRKRMGGVTVKRNPDGTVDIIDNEMKQTSFSTAGGGASVSSAPGVSITRHSDGRVDVRDTEMSRFADLKAKTTKKAQAGRKAASTGSSTQNQGDLSVKRNADGTIDVIDTSSTTRRK